MENSADNNSRTDLSRKPSRAIMSPFIQRQKVECQDGASCPESVAKVIVIDREKIRYCTGTLIAPDIMMTSSSCLTPSLRTPQLDCSQNIFVVFPRTGIQSMYRAGCDRVLSSDGGGDENSEASLWRGDFAFFRLDQAVPRKAASMNRRGPKKFSTYTTWKVDYVTDTEAVLKKATCYPIFKSYANPFATNPRSPMIPVSDCELVEGNAGAPIMDGKGEVTGISSVSLNEKIRQFILNSDLLDEPIAHIHHMANLACAQTPLDNSSTIMGKSCSKPLNVNLLDQLRSEMIYSSEIHKDEFEQIIEELEVPVKYFKWKFDFVQGPGRIYEANIQAPKCFFDIKNWIGEFTRFGGRIRTFAVLNLDVPIFHVKTKLSRLLKPMSVVESGDLKSYRIELNPKNAFKFGNTFVNLQGTLFGQEVISTFEQIGPCE